VAKVIKSVNSSAIDFYPIHDYWTTYKSWDRERKSGAFLEHPAKEYSKRRFHNSAVSCSLEAKTLY
jgi:hypothetical protein